MQKRHAELKIDGPPLKKPAFAKQKLVTDMFGNLFTKQKPLRIPLYFCYSEFSGQVWFSNELPAGDDWVCSGKIGGEKQATKLPEIALLYRPAFVPEEEEKHEDKQDQLPRTYLQYVKHKKERKYGKWTEVQIQYFKSLWQKRTRRSSLQALFAAAEILAHSPLDFMRRLPVLNVEDTVLMAELPRVIWMMAALSSNAKTMKNKTLPKRYVPWHVDDKEASWLLRFVTAMTLCPTVDRVGHDAEITVSDRQIAELKAPQQTLLWSLKIRSLFGGLKGDAKMFHAAVNTWYRRWTPPATYAPIIELANVKNTLDYMNHRSSDYNWAEHATQIEKMQDANELVKLWELAAVDFHCHRKFCDFLPRKLETSKTLAQLANIKWCREHETMALQSGVKELKSAHPSDSSPIDLTEERESSSCAITGEVKTKWIELDSLLWRRIIWCCSSSVTNKKEFTSKPESPDLPFLQHVYSHFEEAIRAQQCVSLQRTFMSST